MPKHKFNDIGLQPPSHRAVARHLQHRRVVTNGLAWEHRRADEVGAGEEEVGGGGVERRGVRTASVLHLRKCAPQPQGGERKKKHIPEYGHFPKNNPIPGTS